MIQLQAEGKRGNGVRTIGEKGFVRVDLSSNIYDSQFIAVDGYEGRGENYRPRQEAKIVIGNGQETFEFNSFEELIKQLKK
jgi:hypothetical protein